MGLVMKWILAYLADGKRITIVLIALLNLLSGKLAALGLPVPDGATEQVASWLGVAVLAAWSKISAQLAAQAAAPPQKPPR